MTAINFCDSNMKIRVLKNLLRTSKFNQIETRDINNIVASNVIYVSAETDQVKTFIYDMLYMHIINGWFFKSNQKMYDFFLSKEFEIELLKYVYSK